MKDKMDHPVNGELVADQKGSANQKSSGVDSTRRRLFGAGVAAPIILSMSSRTAWGGALCAPSAFNSVTFSSQNPADTAACRAPAGKSPTYWSNPHTVWPTGILPTDLFMAYFSYAPLAAYTLQQVLDAPSSGAPTNSIAPHAIAALLNAQIGGSEGITLGESSNIAAVARVKSMFNEFLQGSGYTTTVGTEVFWDTGPSGYSMEAYFTNYIDDPYP